MSAILIRNGRVIDPSQKIDGTFDLLIHDGVVELVKPSDKKRSEKINELHVIDATGKWVVPGFVDLHTHLREPGREDKETIASGTRAAIAGGFTSICAMPNTEPAMDHGGIVEQVLQQARRANNAQVYPIGAITLGRKGKELTNFQELFEAGCVGLSDDGDPLTNSLLMRRALEASRVFNRPIIQHAEDKALFGKGVMHEGYVSTVLGVEGIPSETETIIIARDIDLAALTGGWLHVAHISTAKGVDLVRQAKKLGIRVTCEVTPHHLALTHEELKGFNSMAKVNPPLRTSKDRDALVQGVMDGTIDCIATDHAPHTDWEKCAPLDTAPFGISGLETAFALCYQSLVEPGHISENRLIELMTSAPAELIRIEAGTLKKDSIADFVLVDPEQSWKVNAKTFVSRGKNTPVEGRVLPVKIVGVFKNGEMKFLEEEKTQRSEHA